MLTLVKIEVLSPHILPLLSKLKPSKKLVLFPVAFFLPVGSHKSVDLVWNSMSFLCYVSLLFDIFVICATKLDSRAFICLWFQLLMGILIFLVTTRYSLCPMVLVQYCILGSPKILVLFQKLKWKVYKIPWTNHHKWLKVVFDKENTKRCVGNLINLSKEACINCMSP